jgi:hypothetical protein
LVERRFGLVAFEPEAAGVFVRVVAGDDALVAALTLALDVRAVLADAGDLGEADAVPPAAAVALVAASVGVAFRAVSPTSADRTSRLATTASASST